jgi:predicted GNAT superfamily acetyltransferase
LKNATLNLVHLRARATALLPDFYGPLGGIYGALSTDRFEISWRLDAPEVERAATGHAAPPSWEGPIPVVDTPGKVARAGPRVALPLLAGAPAVYRSDPARSLRARLRFRAAARALFAAGYEAVGITQREGATAYVMERG